MDPRIWSRLPEDLLERVLSFLPLKAFFSLRSTCKHFNSLVFSPCFLSRHSSTPFCSFLLLSHPHFHNQFALFDTTLNAWRNSSSSFLFSMPCSSSSPSLLLSISHGLLCFSHPNSSSFLICNLLARSSRIVKFPAHPFAFEFLTLVSTPSGYRIFMLSSSSSSSSSASSNNAFVYDSSVHLWRQFDRVESILDDNYHQGGAFYNGFLYFTTPEPFSIVRFDLDIGKWDRPKIVLPSGLAFFRLVSDGDKKLYLIGGIGHHGISRSVKLWELGGGGGDGDGENWVEIVTVPEMMGRKFTGICYHNYGHVYCFYHQGLICVCCYTWPEILYYKVSRRTWHWLPTCPWLPEKWSCGFRWFPLVPELHAYV